MGSRELYSISPKYKRHGMWNPIYAEDQVSATAKDELSYVKLNLVTSFDAKTIIKVDLL